MVGKLSAPWLPCGQHASCCPALPHPARQPPARRRLEQLAARGMHDARMNPCAHAGSTASSSRTSASRRAAWRPSTSRVGCCLALAAAPCTKELAACAAGLPAGLEVAAASLQGRPLSPSPHVACSLPSPHPLLPLLPCREEGVCRAARAVPRRHGARRVHRGRGLPLHQLLAALVRGGWAGSWAGCRVAYASCARTALAARTLARLQSQHACSLALEASGTLSGLSLDPPQH